MWIAQEEIFGPTTALIRATDVDEAIKIANGIEFASRPRSSPAT